MEEKALQNIIEEYETLTKAEYSEEFIAEHLYEIAKEAMKNRYGYIVINCVKCHKSHKLHYTDKTQREVSVDGLEGWVSPPPTCPDCHKATQTPHMGN